MLNALIRSGIYVGGTANAIYAHNKRKEIQIFPNLPLTTNEETGDVMGGELGFLIGYLYRFPDSHFMVGPHFEAKYSLLKSEIKLFPPLLLSFDVRMPLTVLAAGRFGYICRDCLLLYGILGVKTRNMQYEAIDAGTVAVSDQRWAWGLLMGVGFERTLNKYRHRLSLELNASLYGTVKFEGTSTDAVQYFSRLCLKTVEAKLAYIVPF